MEKHDFNALAKTHKSVRMRLRFLTLTYFQEGKSRTAIAKFLKVSRTSVNKWVVQYHQHGMNGLIDKKTTGRPFRLSITQRQQLIEFIGKESKSERGGRLNGTNIQHYINENYNVPYHLSSIYKLLHKLGFSWITSRSKHPKQSIEAQEDFKKFQIKTILKIPRHISLDRVDIWLQYEARFGQQNTTTHLWARTGSHPRAVKQQQFEYAYLFVQFVLPMELQKQWL